MAINDKRGYRRGLVDLRAGEISREIFVNEDIYQEELEQVFGRAWLYVGHESQIPNPGDFFVSSMGEEMASGSDESGWARDRRVDFKSK